MPEFTKTKDRRPKIKDRIIWLSFVGLIVFTYFFGLSLPLVGPDEARYAQVAREMFERGDWITPTLGGAHWFEKPALLYWLQIAAYKIFGVSEFAARVGSAIFGLGTIFSLWILGKAVESAEQKTPSSETEDHRPKIDFANRLALIAASSIGLLAFARGASFDIILTFPLTAALVCFFVYDSKTSGLKYLFGFYFFVGVALLAKGLIGIVFPFAIVAFYLLLARRMPGINFVVSLFWGTVLSLAVAASWYLPMYQRHGWEFVDEFFIQHHFARYTSNKYLHPQPFYFFLWVLPLMTLPWLPFFLRAVWDFIKSQVSNLRSQVENRSPRPRVAASPRHLLFSLSWLLVPLAFFSFSGSKLPGYILPALPAALILTAAAIERFARRSARRHRIVPGVALATFVIIIAALQFFVPAFARRDTTKHLFETAAARGFQNARVLNLHTISHNAEFYAAGRTVRDADGKLKRFNGVSEVADEIRWQNAETVLVLISLEYLHELPQSDLVNAEILGDNGETAIAAVRLK